MPESEYRMPAEWTSHRATLIAWPQREEAWRGVGIEQARDSHAEVVDVIAASEPVILVVDPTQLDDARRRVPAAGVELLSLPIDDSWLRDSGPIFVVSGDGELAGVDFVFNAWGEAFSPYEDDAAVASRILEHLDVSRIPSGMVLEGGSIAVDGTGRLITTEQCLLAQSRNPGMDRTAIEAELGSRLGVEEILWLGRGLVEDADTDGHVDNIAAFTEPGKVMLQMAPAGDPNEEICVANLERLEQAGLEVVTLDLLPKFTRDDGSTVVVSYMNFYVANGVVVVPIGGLDPDMDEEALALIAREFPGREVIGVDGRTLAMGGGGVHCITQQVPAAEGMVGG
jgi:agmatine deiminase